MKRREFLKVTGMASASALSMPFILPSGRVFARSGSRLANHVVFVLFAGGIRNQESVYQGYLSSHAGGPSGNVLPNMLAGAPPSSSLVYSPWEPAVAVPLSQRGALFRHMRYAQGPTGHYNGHTVAMTGHYTDTGLNLNINPEWPTVFEYYRKHSEPAPAARSCWWFSTDLGPYPSLNFSRHPEYGAAYGANYLMPGYGLGEAAQRYLGGLQTLHPEESARVEGLRSQLNGFFRQAASGASGGVENTAEDARLIQQLYLDLINGQTSLELPLPPGVPPYMLSGDGANMATAWKILDTFAPELVVINMTNSDVCHDNFSGYIDLMHRADYAVGWLWRKIQEHPVLANDTIMICMPEHGRNLEPNGLLDANGIRAFDHTSDENSRDIFGLIVGPPGKVAQGSAFGSSLAPVGESIDIVPTIAHILGFHDSIPSGMLPGRVLHEAFT
jgi:hypothetical protein